jgi:hypothetical protein
LGVTINEKLKWSDHISNVSSKASEVLGMAKRNFWNCPFYVKETVYTTIVRPKLEYAHTVWDPFYMKDIKMLENVQRNAARFCLQNYAPTASVTEMLNDLGWKTSEQRWKEARLTMMYQMSYNLIDFNTDNYLIPHTETRTRGSHPLKFQIPRANKDSFKFSYFPRTIKEWNQLPEHIVLSNSLEVFKSKLAEHF